jgi:hypothetical protein
MKDEIRFIVTAVTSIPVNRLAYKKDAYRTAAKPGWGLIDWYSIDNKAQPVCGDSSDKTQYLSCDEDSSGILYLKSGKEFLIFPNEEISRLPKQSEVEAIIISDPCGFTFYAEDNINIFVTYDENGLIDTYRMEYKDSKAYEGETMIGFNDLSITEGCVA